MEKAVRLVEKVKGKDGQEIATLQTTLQGDGSTPVIMVAGAGLANVIGYNDDGTAIIDPQAEAIIDEAKIKFMAKAIKEQKELCVENGIDPNLVNMLNAEKKVDNE